MIEVSLWLLVGFAEILFVAALAFVLMMLLHRSKCRLLETKIEKLKKELATNQGPPDLDDPEPSEDEAAPPEPAVAGPPQLILLSQDDVAASTRPQPQAAEASDGESEGEAAGAPSSGDVYEQLLERNQVLTNSLNTLLEKSAELAMKLGGIHGTEGLDPVVKTEIQDAIDQMRGSDEILVEAADKGMEIDETVRHMQSTANEKEDETPVDHVALNEILMARADGQTEEELEQLREEVRQRLLKPPVDEEAVTKAAEEKIQALDAQLTDLKTQLDHEQNEREQIETKFGEVTEEYQKLFEQFQPSL